MKLYIEIENGQPKNHPALEENLIDVFKTIPEHWVPFERITKPVLNVYEVWVTTEPTYELVDGVYKDVWHTRSMTDEEITIKQNKLKADWEENGFSSWTFNPTTCSFVPPTPYPNDGKVYRWDESITSWIEIT
jgi:hypothetical protein